MRTLKNVDLTPEQLPILADAALGFRLIRGAAGSGKTTTAVYRLRQLCAAFKAQRERDDSGQPVRVLVLTFNRTLCGYINQLANEQIQDTAGIDFTIETFSRWALHLVGQRNIIDDPGLYVRPLLRKLGGNVSANLDYFADEVNHIMGRFTPASRQEYLGVERTGRGRAPAVNQQLRKRLLTDVVAPYEARKQRDDASDWNDVALAAAAATSRQGYDIVVADETQDFSANQIRAIRAHLSDNHATTFIMDAAQRIYSQGFTWRETGIELRPQMVRTLGRRCIAGCGCLPGIWDAPEVARWNIQQSARLYAERNPAVSRQRRSNSDTASPRWWLVQCSAQYAGPAQHILLRIDPSPGMA